MKVLKFPLQLLVAGALLFAACEKSEAITTLNVVPDTTLSNVEIGEKIAQFRAAPSRDAHPTDAVASKFREQFSGAYDVEWEVSNGVYEVEFEISRVDCKAWYDEAGFLLMCKFDLPTRKIPAIVKNAVNQKYPKFRIDDADKILMGSDILYEVSIEKGKEEYKVYFKEDGTFVREIWD